MNRRLGSLYAVLALLTSLAVAAPALAATGSLDDPAGDATQNGLDITRAALDNDDRRIVVRVRFDELKKSDLIVSVDPRGARGLRMVSEYDPDGETKNYLLPSAFSDKGGRGEAAPECPGFRVRWNDASSRATLRLPSTCLQDGDYGAVRFAVLTERGADADYAPEGRRGVSGWIARG